MLTNPLVQLYIYFALKVSPKKTREIAMKIAMRNCNCGGNVFEVHQLVPWGLFT